jgi:hypothetical protein
LDTYLVGNASASLARTEFFFSDRVLKFDLPTIPPADVRPVHAISFTPVRR